MTHSYDVEFAKRYGIGPAVLIQYFAWCIIRNEANGRNWSDGHYWTYNTMAALQQLFPEFNCRNAVEKLKKAGVLYTASHNKNNLDRTLWYSLPEELLSRYRPSNREKQQMHVRNSATAVAEKSKAIPVNRPVNTPYYPPLTMELECGEVVHY